MIRSPMLPRASASPLFLGIDGGGTRTTAWLADGQGCVRARAEAGPSNPLKVGVELAEREILTAAARALRSARRQQRLLAGVCLGLAGADRPAVQRKMLRWLRRAIPARSHLVTSDAAITLEAALGGQPGIVVMAGTGSIAYGRSGDGRVGRCGGWGVPFDDQGSGYDLGRKAVTAALRAFDGRGPQTALGLMVCRALKLREVTEIVERRLAQHQIAALFPLVIEAAHRRDTVAQRLLDEGGRDLAELAWTLLRRLPPLPTPTRVVCAGGVFEASPAVRRRFAKYLRPHAPRLRISMLQGRPVEGALELARKHYERVAGRLSPVSSGSVRVFDVHR